MQKFTNVTTLPVPDRRATNHTKATRKLTHRVSVRDVKGGTGSWDMCRKWKSNAIYHVQMLTEPPRSFVDWYDTRRCSKSDDRNWLIVVLVTTFSCRPCYPEASYSHFHCNWSIADFLSAAVMDAALLLIAGNETCPQPQTSEHLAAIEIMKLGEPPHLLHFTIWAVWALLTNVEHIIILQNKVDLMREEGADQHYKSILQFIRGTVADGSPIVPISA